MMLGKVKRVMMISKPNNIKAPVEKQEESAEQAQAAELGSSPAAFTSVGAGSVRPR